MHACMHIKSLQSCTTLFDRIDCSPWGSSVHGILQARILECIAMPSPWRPSWSRDQAPVSCFLHWQADSLPLVPPGFSSVQFSSVTQSCPTLCDPMNRSTPGLPVQGSNHQIIFHCNSQKSRVWAGKHNWDTSKARHCLFNSSLAIVTSTEMYWPGTFVYPFVESGKKSKGFRYFVWLWV